MGKYIVKMTLEQSVEAQDEDDAVESAKLNFDYSDLHYANIEVYEERGRTWVRKDIQQ